MPRAPTTGRFNTRLELETFVCLEWLTSKRNLNQIARAARVSSTTVGKIIDQKASLYRREASGH